MKILVTGAAGFIGSFVAERFAKDGHIVVGIDNLCNFYDISLKRARLDRISVYQNFSFHLVDITDAGLMSDLFAENKFDYVIHLAGQPSVQHSKKDPTVYVNSNILGMLQVLENCRIYGVRHLVYASSSSVYGDSKDSKIAEDSDTDSPLSIYAVTKKTNELMAHTYSHIYQLPTTGLRLFSVYGPWGRPDMAPYIFTEAILDGVTVNVYGDGSNERAFTYIDDVVEVISQIYEKYPGAGMAGDTEKYVGVPFKILNVGGSTAIRIDELIAAIESEVSLKAKIEFHAPKTGDAKKLVCDSASMQSLIEFPNYTDIESGISKFIQWYKSYCHREAKDTSVSNTAAPSICRENNATLKPSRSLLDVAREEYRKNWQKTAKEDPKTVAEMKRRNAELKKLGLI
nr:NAD-dependent epimerase/dehydratase family protein [uncultured Undibacterium sp.]